MSGDTLLRVLALCVLLAGAETLHGIARTLWVARRLGKARAMRLSAVTGSMLAVLICTLSVPAMGLVGPAQHLALGGVLAAFMAAFDLAIGRLVMRKAWSALWPDFDPRTGNYLSLALAILAVTPLGVSWLHAAAG